MKNSVDIKITISPAPGSNLQIDASGVPTSGTVGQPFTGDIKVSGGTAPYSFQVTSGELPDGVSLMSDGTFEGTPTVAGDFAFTVEVADAQG